MNTYFHVENGVIIRVERVQGQGTYDPGPNAVLVADDPDARTGDLWDGTRRTRPAVVVVVPASVTNFQARAVLMQMPSPSGVEGRTLFDDVNEALLAQGGVAKQAWEYANDVTRDGPLVNSLGTQLGMTSAQLDALFVAAAGISA